MSLYANIHKKRKRIAAGSGEKMRKKGEKGAPTSEQMKKAQADHNEESGMILSQISKSIDQLNELKSMINAMPEDADFEGWVQSKFTKIADYVNSVHSYIKYYESDDEMEASFNYDMTSEEYDEVMTIEDIISAARPGPKSAAQTPAKPSERKKGSSKNKPGSAGSKGGKINF